MHYVLYLSRVLSSWGDRSWSFLSALFMLLLQVDFSGCKWIFLLEFWVINLRRKCFSFSISAQKPPIGCGVLLDDKNDKIWWHWLWLMIRWHWWWQWWKYSKFQPNSLQLVAVYGLASSVAVLVFCAWIGHLVDRQPHHHHYCYDYDNINDNDDILHQPKSHMMMTTSGLADWRRQQWRCLYKTPVSF